MTTKTMTATIGPGINKPKIKTALPGPNAKRVLEADEKYISPSYTRSYPLVAKSGHQGTAMALAPLAYTIFTLTLVIQRKEAARNLSFGLLSLAVPAVPLALLYGYLIPAVAVAVFAFVLFRGLRAPAARAWLDQP